MAIELMIPRAKIIVPKPKSYVKLDMAFGVGEGTKLFDKSRYRSHGTIVGADWATGVHGTCLDFVAASKDYVEIPASYTQLNFTSQKYSIIVRIKVDAVDTEMVFFIRGLYNVDGYDFIMRPTGFLRARTYQSGANQISATTAGTIVSDSQYTIGCSRNGSSIRVFINGVDKTTTAGTHTNPATCVRSAKIGIYDDKVTAPLNGKIEFLRIFGGIALSASEHLAYHNALA